MTRNFSAAYRGKAAALREWDGAQESVRDTPWSLGLGIVQMETLESPAEFLCCEQIVPCWEMSESQPWKDESTH